MKRQAIILTISFIVVMLIMVYSSGVTSAVPQSASVQREEQRAFELLNADRRANGLAALAWNPQLAELARDYGQDMLSRDFFSHDNPEGQSPFDRMRARGITFRYAGENLASNGSVEAAESAFMDSPGHRANILNSHFNKVGIGVCRGNDGSVYVIQEFIGN